MHRWIAIFLLSLFSFSLPVFADTGGQTQHSLTVAIIKQPSAKAIDIIAFQVWQAVAKEMGVNYTLAPVNNEQQALDLLRNHKADLVMGPIKLDRKQKDIEYLNTYIQDNIGVVITPKSLSFYSHISPYIHIIFGTAVGILLLVLIIVGILVWLAEYRENAEQFPKPFWRGLGNGIWFAIVSLTTVGFGDRAPVTLVGRIIASIWLIVSVFVLSSFIAIVSAALTHAKTHQSSITNVGELKNKRIVYLRNDPLLEKNAVHLTYRSVPVNSMQQGLELLEKGKADAGIFERIALRFYVHKHPQVDVILTPIKMTNGDYAFAVRKGSSLADRINQALFTQEEIGTINHIIYSVLGADVDSVVAAK